MFIPSLFHIYALIRHSSCDIMTLSIIIAVFNSEKTVRCCLESILDCNLQDCEIILAVGRYSDCSNTICEEYQREHSFIRIVMQDGQGLSNARNSALRSALGEYILFIDADDYVDSSVLDKDTYTDDALSPDADTDKRRLCIHSGITSFRDKYQGKDIFCIYRAGEAAYT